MKNFLIFFVCLLSTLSLYSQNNCPLNIRVNTEEGTCYNNCMINISLVDNNGQLLDTLTTDISDIKYFCVNIVSQDTSYSHLNRFAVSPGTYKVGVQAICYYSTSADSMYIRMEKDTIVTTKTSYQTPVVSILSNLARNEVEQGTINTIECANIGRLQLRITGGSFPYFVKVCDEFDNPLDTLIFYYHMYNGTSSERYDYKDNYSIDSLGAGIYKIYVWDGCDYNLPYVRGVINTSDLPHINNVCWYYFSDDINNQNVIKIQARIAWVDQYISRTFQNEIEYRFIYPEINGVRDTTTWKQLSRITNATSGYVTQVLYDTAYQASRYCDLFGEPIIFQSRNKLCDEHFFSSSYTYDKPLANRFSISRTFIADSIINTPYIYDSCGFKDSESILHGYYEFQIRYSQQYEKTGSTCTYSQTPYHYTAPLYWVYTDTATHAIIKIDTIFDITGTSVLRGSDIIGIYGDFRDSSITIPVQRTLYDKMGCELYTRFDQLTYKIITERSGGYYYTRGFDLRGLMNNDYCCIGKRGLTLRERNSIPISYNGNFIIKLIESPLGNKYNFTLTYDQNSDNWTVVKDSLSNLATINLMITSLIELQVTDYCLPSGRYTFQVITPCKTYEITSIYNFNDTYEYFMVPPTYEYTTKCTEMLIKPIEGRYRVLRYNIATTNTSEYSIGDPIIKEEVQECSFRIVEGPSGGYSNSSVNLGGEMKISMPGRYIICMQPKSYLCEVEFKYDTVYFNGGTVEYDYEYAYVCDSTSTSGFVRVKGKNGTMPYTYTLYSGPNLTGDILGENESGRFDNVPLYSGQQISVKISDSCMSSFPLNMIVFDMEKANKNWFAGDIKVKETCEGSQITVYATGQEDIFSYQWTGPNGFSANTKDASVFIPRGAENGYFKVTLLNTGCHNPITDSIYLNVIRAAKVVIEEDANVCPGEEVQLKFTANGTGNVYYIIGYEENSVVRYLHHTNNYSYTYNPFSSGIFWVHEVRDDLCVYSMPEDTIHITLKDNIATSCDVLTTPDTMICLDSNAVVYATSTLTTPYIIRWYDRLEQTHILQADTIYDPMDKASYAFTHLGHDTTLYVTAYNNAHCETRFGVINRWRNMQNGTTSIRCGESINIYDSGGYDKEYSNNENITHIFTSTDGSPIILKFNAFNTESDDKLFVFTGSGTNPDSIIATLSGNLDSNLPADIVSNSGSMTICFLSNAYSTYSGWNAIVSNNPEPSSVTVSVSDSVKVKILPTTSIPVHYDGNITFMSIASGGRGQDYEYHWLSSTDGTNWISELLTTTSADTVYHTFTNLTQSLYVKVIIKDVSMDACGGNDTVMYFIPIANIKLSLNLSIETDDPCNPIYNALLTVKNNGEQSAEDIVCHLHMPNDFRLFNSNDTIIRISTLAANESKTDTIQLFLPNRPSIDTNLIVKAQIWSCRQGDTVPETIYGDWDWQGLPRQVDEDSANVHILPRFASGDYNLSTIDDEICFGDDALLSAYSDIPAPQYFHWYSDQSLSNLVQRDTVYNSGDHANLTVSNLRTPTIMYVTVQNSEKCPPTVSGIMDFKFDTPITDTVGIENGITQVGIYDHIKFNDKRERFDAYEKITQTFSTEEGVLKIFFNNINLGMNVSVGIYDGPNTSSPRIIYVSRSTELSQTSFTSTTGNLTIDISNNSNILHYPSLDAEIINTQYVKSAMASATINEHLSSVNISATNDEICYGEDALLTASSSIAFPQYYTWWDRDQTTLLFSDTVTVPGNSSEFRPTHQITDSLYYVHVHNEENCPFTPELKQQKISRPEVLMDKTSSNNIDVHCLDSIPFYDYGGKNGNTFNNNYYQLFTAEEGYQVILHFDTLKLPPFSRYSLKIYDGQNASGPILAELYDIRRNLTFTSTRGSLYLVHNSISDYMGWSGYVTTDCDLVDLATAKVSVIPQIPNTTISYTICQNPIPFSYMGFNDIDVSVAGNYTIDSVLTSYIGCDSTITLNLTVNPIYELKDTLTICENGLPYTWRDTVFLTGTVSGDYSILRQTAEGCDSTMQLHLTVNPSYELKDTVTICENGLPYTWRDTAFLAGTVSGDYAILRQTVNGCDSTMKLNLTVYPSFKDTVFKDTLFVGIPYDMTVHNVLFHVDGPGTMIKYKTLRTAFGCDSIQTIILTVHKSIEYYATVCQSQVNSYTGPYHTLASDLFGQSTLDSLVKASGYIYKENVYMSDGLGNDSVVSFYLTVTPHLVHDTTVVITNMHGGYDWHGSTYTEPGLYTFYTQESGGCDVLDILTLRKIQIDTTANAICYGDSTVKTITATLSDVTFKTNLISHPVLPGDILCTDGAILNPDSFATSGKIAKGVVFHTDKEKGTGLAVALTDVNRLQWSSSSLQINSLIDSYGNALSDMEGMENTLNIISSIASRDEVPPAYDCYYYDHTNLSPGTEHKGWYLPSAGELRLLYSSRQQVNTTLNALSASDTAIAPLNYYYWSSTEYSMNNAWLLFNSGILGFYPKNEDRATRAITSFTYTPTPLINVGDLYTFPDSSQGIVCYVEPGLPQKGWVAALEDLDQTYAIYTNSTLPGGWVAPAILPDSTSLTVWQSEGEQNTRLLRASGNSPAANAVDFAHGWYIPDAVQLANIVGLIPVLNDKFVAAGGSISKLSSRGQYYWSSSLSDENNRAFYLYNGNFGGGMRKDMNNNRPFNIRAVRNFGVDPELNAYWEIAPDTNSIQVKPAVTTAYNGVVAFGPDTFRLQSSVVVYPVYPNDTISPDTICICDITNDTVNINHHTFVGVTGPGMYYTTNTMSSIHGCDSVVTWSLVVNPCYVIPDTAIICSDDLPYVWNGVTFNSAGDQSVKLSTALGCDSVVNMTLIVNPAYTGVDAINVYDTICSNELPYGWRDTTFLEGSVSGDFVFHRSTVNGCDSTVILHLVINELSVTVASVTDETCGNDGGVTVTATGKAPYEYSLDGVTFQSSPTFTGLASGNHTITARDANGCLATTAFNIAAAAVPTLTVTCPPDIRDTLAYGDCAMKIYPAELGTPTAVHSLGWPFTITNDAPADSLYPEGDNIVMWIMKDDVCGYADTCYQHVHIVFPECPDAVDCEGNVYAGVRIGCDCWTQRNLESTKYSDCTDIPCVYEYVSADHPNAAANVNIFGRLYCFEAAVRDSSDNGHGHIQGICPAGWYLPTPEKYEALNAYGAEALRSPLYWITGRGNNSTGFTALPAGYYNGSIRRYENLLGATYFWSTSNTGGGTRSSAYSTFLNCDYVLQVQNAYGNGYSVRCIKEKESSATLPTVTTAAVTNVTAITATCGGEVTADGGAPVTACGVCWSISQNPTINDSLTTNGSDIGRFTSSLTRLIPGTTYYVRAYATNSAGTAYGNEVSFTAQNGPCPLHTTVSDNDGHTYNTVLIGNQCWMKENLRTKKYPDGSDISTDGYYDYNTSSLPLVQRGFLYNWTTVMNGANSSEANPSGVQGICPKGWHVPSSVEWQQLRDYVLSQNEYTCSNTGGCAKALASPIGWNTSESPCAVGNTPGNNNATGFSALPVGFWSVIVSYGGAYNETNFWSSTEGSASSLAFAPEIVADGDRMSVDQFRKTSAFSVRCIRDVVIDENSCAEAETVTDKEGNVYATVKIGNQCWMRENLRTKKYKDGTDIAAGENNTSVTEGYYYDVTSTGIALTQRGYHYNWSAANLICPDGWHLPSDAEWNTMEQTLSGSDWQDDYTTSTGFRGSHAGKLALAGGNESGFSAVPAGACVGLFSSTSLGYDAYFWSSTPGNSDGACSRALDHNRAGVERSYYGKFNGFSVRCVKNVVVVDEKSCTEAQTVTDHEGNVYATVKIGNQCWMRDNLRTTTSPSTGTYLIPAEGTDATLTGKQAHWYNNDSVQYAPQNYGLLYNWNAAMDTFNTVLGETSVDKTSDNAISVTFTGHRRGICPNGWHVPSQSEWNVLSNSVSSINEYICDYNSNNIAKALADTSGWQNCSSICAPGNIPTENNKTGFSILPVSLINAYNNYGQFGRSAYFWSATEAGNYSNARYFYLIFTEAHLYQNSYHKGYGLSVRCVRD